VHRQDLLSQFGREIKIIDSKVEEVKNTEKFTETKRKFTNDLKQFNKSIVNRKISDISEVILKQAKMQ